MPRHMYRERAEKAPQGWRTCRYCRRVFRVPSGPRTVRGPEGKCPACCVQVPRVNGAAQRAADFRAARVEALRRRAEAELPLFEESPS